eukprot:scaffold83910_cov69-Phaeocystis_antarctica.AAC.2
MSTPCSAGVNSTPRRRSARQRSSAGRCAPEEASACSSGAHVRTLGRKLSVAIRRRSTCDASASSPASTSARMSTAASTTRGSATHSAIARLCTSRPPLLSGARCAPSSNACCAAAHWSQAGSSSHSRSLSSRPLSSSLYSFFWDLLLSARAGCEGVTATSKPLLAASRLAAATSISGAEAAAEASSQARPRPELEGG